MTVQMFHLGDILSVSTGILMPTNGIGGLYDILNFMTGDNLYTPAIPRAVKECRPYLLIEMPWLEDIDASGVGCDNCEEWEAKQVEEHGEYPEVRPIHPEDHEVIGLIEEIKRMNPDIEVIEIHITEDGTSPSIGDLPPKDR